MGWETEVRDTTMGLKEHMPHCWSVDYLKTVEYLKALKCISQMGKLRSEVVRQCS